MTENAKKAWEILRKHNLETVGEYYIEDMDEFAAGVDCDSERAVIHALYVLTTPTTA
jgi:hypothetical protein